MMVNGHDHNHDSGKDGHCEPGKVARELVGEAPDVRQLLVVHITEPGDICALIRRLSPGFEIYLTRGPGVYTW